MVNENAEVESREREKKKGVCLIERKNNLEIESRNRKQKIEKAEIESRKNI